jgi:hypothetical protein
VYLAGETQLFKDAKTVISIHRFITGTLERWQHLRGWNPDHPEYLADDEVF